MSGPLSWLLDACAVLGTLIHLWLLAANPDDALPPSRERRFLLRSRFGRYRLFTLHVDAGVRTPRDRLLSALDRLWQVWCKQIWQPIPVQGMDNPKNNTITRCSWRFFHYSNFSNNSFGSLRLLKVFICQNGERETSRTFSSATNILGRFNTSVYRGLEAF